MIKFDSISCRLFFYSVPSAEVITYIDIYYSIRRGCREEYFITKVTPTSDVLGIVSMSNWVYRWETKSACRVLLFFCFIFYFYTSSLKEAI